MTRKELKTPFSKALGDGHNGCVFETVLNNEYYSSKKVAVKTPKWFPANPSGNMDDNAIDEEDSCIAPRLLRSSNVHEFLMEATIMQ